ncbi:hypothetical protein D3C87_2166210 [compost metagenome]
MERSGLGREHRLPIALHADDRPAPGGGFVEGLVQLADLRLPVVGVLADGVVVVDQDL